jgi:hypothetical protein
MATQGILNPSGTPGKENRWYLIRVGLFWSGIGAAVILALTTGVTSWQDYMVKEAARYQLRAHIVVRPEQLPTLEEGKRPRVRGSYYNIGRTPAYDEGSTSHILVAEYPLTHRLPDKECDKEKTALRRKNKWFVGQVPHPETVREEPFTSSEIEAIKQGRAAVYFYGRVCYADIFSESHRTDFCLVWKWDGGRFSPGLYCGQGNSNT